MEGNRIERTKTIATKYEIARPSFRNIEVTSNLILVGLEIATLAHGGWHFCEARMLVRCAGDATGRMPA
jgi:hypothetical protein